MTPSKSDRNLDDSPSQITLIRIHDILLTLVNLKLEEIAAANAVPTDHKKLQLTPAQEKALEQKILKLTITTLEDEERRLSDRYLPERPKMRAAKAEIDARKREVSALY